QGVAEPATQLVGICAFQWKEAPREARGGSQAPQTGPRSGIPPLGRTGRMTIRSLAGQATSGQKREEGGNGRGFPTFWHPGKRGRPFSPNAESGIIRTAVSHQINHAAEADGGAAVEAGPGQQELGREVGLARAG